MVSLVALAVLAGVVLLAVLAVQHYRVKVLLPGPFSLPVLGNFLQYMTIGSKHVQLLRRWQDKYGPLYHAFLPGPGYCMRLVLSSEPEILKHWLSTAFNEGVYGKGPFFQDMYREFLGAGIFNVNGSEWKHQRAVASQLFHISRLRQHLAVFHRQALVFLAEMDRAVGTQGDAVVDMQSAFMNYTLDSFAEIGFGVQLDTIRNGSSKFQEAFDYVQTQTEARGRVGDFWKVLNVVWRDRQYYDHLEYMNQFTRAIITERKREETQRLEEREDLLSILLAQERAELSKGNERASLGMGDEELRDFVMNFMLAGRDTTAVLLTWCTYMVARHPEVQQRIRDEMAAVLGEAGVQPESWSEMKKMVYLKQVLQETLRLYPPVPLEGFHAFEDDELPGGHAVKKGDQLLYSAYALHRDPRHWPEPDAFKPERFETPPAPYTFLPFHGGPRTCLGQEMAYLEAKIMMCSLLSRYRVEPVREVDIRAAIILTADGGMPIRLVPL